MRVPEYFWYDPFNPEDLAGFSLDKGVYQPIAVNAQNQLVSQSLRLGLQLWPGNYKGINATWLRWVTLEGDLLPTPAEQEHQRAEQERQRADNAHSQLLQTARNLLNTGMNLEQVARLTGLSVSEIESF